MVSIDEVNSDALGGEIDSYNEIRKTLDRDITQEALDMINRNPDMLDRNSTVIYNRDWHKGVVGIVASRLTEFYYRPTIVLTESNGMATGSARSVKDFDLYDAIGLCSDLLESYGGHMYAAGLTLKIENVSEFSRRFEAIVSRSLAGKPQVQTIDVDARIALHEINSRFYRILRQFEPYGPHNPMPVFLSEDVIDAGTSRLVGKAGEHIKLDLMEPDDSSAVYAGIAFNMSEKFPSIKSGLPFDLCYSVAINEFRGKANLQLYVRDINTHDL